MNNEVINTLLEKNPKLTNSREKLEQMQPGAYCIHRSWGFGKIVEYDPVDEKLTIDFEESSDKREHRMDPAFCVDKLEILAESHILVKQRKDPDQVAELIKGAPVDLIINMLEANGGELSTFEIEKILSRLLDAKKYRKWWSDTRKLLVKDPRIGVPAKKTDPYVLRDEPIKPEDEILEEFYETKQSKRKILLAEKLLALSNDKVELKQDLPEVLRLLTEAIQETRLLTQADRLHGVWVRNDLARDTHADVEQLEPTSASILIAAEDDLSALARQLPASYYTRLLDLITRVFPDKWEDIILSLLRHSEGRFTSDCITFLIEREKMDLLKTSFQRWLNEQTMRGPILLWVLKNRTTKRFSELVDPLFTPHLLHAIFYAIDYESLQNASQRRIALADALIDDRDLIPDLLETTSKEIARDLAQTLLLNQGFEDLTKKSLIARFIKVHPAIQSLVDRGTGTESKIEDSLIVSSESMDVRKREYEELINVKIPENAEAIAEAREHGDLRENSEYKMARQDQDTLMARKAQLEVDLARARVTDFTDAGEENVSIGSVVDVYEEGNERTLTYAILGAWDSDPDKNIVSYKTPLGSALLNHKVGDRVETEIDGQKQGWVIRGIRRWVDSPIAS